MFLGYALHAGGIWNGDISVADIEELEKMEACAIHATRLRAKEVLTPRNGENCYILDRRWNSQALRGRSGSENIHLNPGSPRARRRTRKSSRRIRRVFFNPSSRTHRSLMMKQEMISLSCQGTLFTTITLNPESNCSCGEKHHSQFLGNTSKGSGLQKTSLDVLL